MRDDLEARVEERTADLWRASEGLKAEIAERKRSQDILRERADLLDLTHDTVFVRDANNVITFWNRGAERLYGWTREEAVGQVSHHLMQTTFPAPLEKIMAELNSTGRWEGELIHARRDGTQVVVASRWALQLDERGKPIGILETNNDITERKRAEEALHKAQTELAHVTRVATLGEMTASIAHEVNQPLGAVVNNASACLRWLAGQAPNLEEARKSADAYHHRRPSSQRNHRPDSRPRQESSSRVRTGSTSTRLYLKSSPWRAAKRNRIACRCRLNYRRKCRSFWEIGSNYNK